MSQANDFYNAIRQQQVHKLAGSPLLWQIIQTLKVEQLIDQYCPIVGKQQVSHGQSVLALLLTRLLHPKALYKVADWYAASGMDVLLKHNAVQFTDDRLGEMLDVISDQSETIWMAIIGQVIQVYPEMAEEIIQYDITSCYFEGTYEGVDLIQHGYSRDHRPDARQINLGLSVTGKSGLPLLYEVLAGNTADNQTPFAHLDKLKKLLKTVKYPHDMVFVGDRAMLNRKLITGYVQRNQLFLGPWTPPEVQTIIGAVSQEDLLAHPLTFRPQSAKKDDPPSYYGVMRPLAFAHDEETTDLGVLVLYARGKARLDAQKRDNHLSKLTQKLTDIQQKLNQRRYKTQCYVQHRIQNELRRYPVARRLITWSLTEEDGLLGFEFAPDDEAIAAAQAVDGRYAIVTNSDLSADEILLGYKQQAKAEGRFRIIKGPIPLRPVHLRKEKRITALVFLTMLALVIYTILEWLVRRRTPGRKRPWTGRAILEVFEEFSVVAQLFKDGSRLWLPPPLRQDQQLLWDVLNLPNISDFLASLEVGT